MQTTHTADSQARHMLEAVLRDLPELGEPAADGIETAGLLIRLGRRWPNAPDERECRDLQMLCRQIAVPKKVLRDSPVDDRRVPQGETLPVEYWPLLIAVLLMQAERWPDDDPPGRGLALKCLNGALQALDIAERFGNVPHITALRSWAERMTESVCSENPE